MVLLPISCNPSIKNFQPSKSTLDSSQDKSRKDYRDLRVRLPIRLINKVEKLREEWGIQSRSAVIEKLIEDISEEG